MKSWLTWVATVGLVGLSLVHGQSTVTFHEHLAPVVFQQCAPCHRPGGSAPFSLLTYSEVARRAADLAEVTGRRYMPPWLPSPGPHPFQGERRLTESEIQLFRRWADTGAPAGDSSKSPPIPLITSDWQLGPPDLVVKLSQVYTVPAEGRDVYRNFVLPLNLDRRRHVRAWELRPHSRAAHHAFVRVDTSGEGRRLDAKDAEPGFPGMDLPAMIRPPSGHFASWQPGAAPAQNPPGLPWTLEPDTDLVLQVHLQPTGKPEPFQPELGLYFTDQAPTNQPMKLGLGSFALDIPAGSTNFVARDEFILPTDVDLLGVLPHTHYLGRRVEGKAVLPDGREEPLLLITDWDFNWQGAYRYQTPVFLPAGTKLQMALQFDNTTNNVRNPFSPPRPARYGSDTTNEMAELWIQLLPRTAEGAKRLDQALLRRIALDTVAYNEQRLRTDPNNGLALVNIGRAQLALQQMAQALAMFKHATRVAPQLDEAHYYLALVHRAQNRTQDAVAGFRKTLELNPNHARAHGNLAFLDLEAGRLEQAVGHLQEAIRLDSRDTLALVTLAKVRLRQGAKAEAADLFRKVLKVDPQNAEARAGLKAVGE